ncbi:hypothetical protein [Microcoleus sp. CAWBG58]|uniref:hypothetical protein n=1 Tax=Microcoleus sp. CAWBG58 TaxID=2841651 RepID=UPI0025F56144|nr:hypothetical protein [Microcoleus sp. CAWBG58]
MIINNILEEAIEIANFPNPRRRVLFVWQRFQAPSFVISRKAQQTALFNEI